MDSQKAVILTTGAVLSVVLIVAFVLPIVTSSTADTVEIKNEGIYFDVITDTHVLTFDRNGGEPILTVDNVDISDKLLQTNNNPMQVLAYGDYFNISYSSNAQSLGVYSQHETHPTVYAQKGTITLSPTSAVFQLVNVFESTSFNYTLTVSKVCMVSVDDQGDYVYSKNPLIADDTEISGSYVSNVNNLAIWRTINGTIDDIEVKGYSTEDGAEINLSMKTIIKDADNVAAYVNIDKITEFLIYTTGDGLTTVMPVGYFIVPASITAEKAVHLDSTEITMLELVPLLLVVGVILSIIGYARMRA